MSELLLFLVSLAFPYFLHLQEMGKSVSQIMCFCLVPNLKCLCTAYLVYSIFSSNGTTAPAQSPQQGQRTQI